MRGTFETINKALFYYVKTGVASQMSEFLAVKNWQNNVFDWKMNPPYSEFCGRYSHLSRLKVTVKHAETFGCTVMLNPLFTTK